MEKVQMILFNALVHHNYWDVQKRTMRSKPQPHRLMSRIVR